MSIDLDLHRLRVFVEVVRQGGFSQAAKVVFATQPTVSKAVKQLEDELGMPLLVRVGQRSELTPAGKIVYRRALGLLTEGGDLITELDELRGLKRGTLRIGFPRLGSSALFAPLYVSYRRRYPDVEVNIVIQDSKDLEELLRAGDLDIAALASPISGDFDSQEVRTEPLVVLLPPDHAFARRKAIKLSNLANFPLILFDEAKVNEMILGACADEGISPKIAAHSSQADFIVELVAAGFGIGFLPRMIAESRPPRSVRHVLLDNAKCRWRVALAWRRSGFLSHAAHAWLAHAREQQIKNG
jgi:DNA-binding transcriptional LysR family regulator